jgi:hypothetical protein
MEDFPEHTHLRTSLSHPWAALLRHVETNKKKNSKNTVLRKKDLRTSLSHPWAAPWRHVETHLIGCSNCRGFHLPPALLLQRPMIGVCVCVCVCVCVFVCVCVGWHAEIARGHVCVCVCVCQC